MRIYISLLLSLGLLYTVQGQQPLKTIPNSPYVQPQPINIAHPVQINSNAGRTVSSQPQNKSGSVYPNDPAIEKFHIMSSGSFWIDLKPNELWESRASVTDVMSKLVQLSTPVENEAIEWKIISTQSDKQGQEHVRVQQNVLGIPIKNQEMILHLTEHQVRGINGFAWTATFPKQLPETRNPEEVQQAAKSFLESRNVKFQTSTTLVSVHSADKAELIWMPKDGKLVLAYELKMYPNALDHWTVYVNASSLEVMQSISETCSFAPLQLFNHVPVATSVTASAETEIMMSPTVLLDGATVTTDQDLLGQNRTVNGYQVGSNFFMIDASRNGMFSAAQSVLPNEPVGTIWTIDAQNSSPQQMNFEVVQVTNTTNNWKNLEVSAHFNSGKAYEYYLNTFGRNSINGSGGNIISIINVTDQNDTNMDNAFWNGAAMFYGNGDVAFTSLAKGLDVAGHEMSHGVIQNTANLEYLGQSGALNESYADVFGSLIDRDDWRIGEDVVNLTFFPSGALRDLSNPNNGGSGPGDNGWQPKHMNEFQNLPETPDGDNGGVHVNSGIPNKAYFLFANAVGKEKAEKVYYKALTDYLVKSSQFIDMRLAVEKAATDLHGAGSPEVNAVKSAFDQVGIGAGQGGDYEDDIDTNTGSDFILATDESESDLYFIPPTNPSQLVKMDVPAPISRPSFTDDGSACVYVNNENDMIVINFDWSSGLNYEAFYIETNPQGIWRNVVVSKDGSKIAFTTSNLTNEINVYDFTSGADEIFTLYNPTTAQDVSSDDVLYADAMEWDYSGENIMYDALNRIESSFGDGIEFWDIAFINVWNQQGNHYENGYIDKLFSALPENISIGNPSFAKNSPYIITFDFTEDYFDNFGDLQTDYWVVAANVEDGSVNNIYHNTTVGYPSYSRLDNKILFTYFDNANSTNLLATINIQPGNKTLPVAGSEEVLVTGGQKGVWFVVGNRDFTATEDFTSASQISISPIPAIETIQVSSEKDLQNASYTILDFAGKVIEQGKLNTQNSISVAQLAAGPYLLQIRDKDGLPVSVKFAKQ